MRFYRLAAVPLLACLLAAPAVTPVTAVTGTAAKSCIRDTSHHDKKVPGKPLRQFNAVRFTWCPDTGWTTVKGVRITLKSTNGKNLNCSTVAGVWTKFYFSDELGRNGHKKIHVVCRDGRKQITHTAAVTSGKHYRVRDKWPPWQGYNQVVHYGSPEDFVWIYGHLNPFEVGAMPLVVRMLVAVSARDGAEARL